MYRSGQIFHKDSSSEVTRSVAYLKNWVDLDVQRNEWTKRLYDVTFNAFELFFPTPSDEASVDLAIKLVAVQSSNILVDIVKQAPVPVPLHSTVAGSRYRDWCISGEAYSHTVDYKDYSEVSNNIDVLKVLKLPVPNPVPVPVYIIDVSLKTAPNLFPAYGMEPAGQWKAKGDCNWGEFSLPLHHATHLAGIMFSKGFGFGGLAPNVVFKPFPWAKQDPTDGTKAVSASPDRKIKLAETIWEAEYNTDDMRMRAVFLVPTVFDDYSDIPAMRQILKKTPEARFLDRLGHNIKYLHQLFVVSAGQDETRDPVPLKPDTPLLPQNSGDLPNVIVVTACNRCTRESALLMASANYGATDRNYVHVAAPWGLDLPGWIDDGHVGSAGGTSQAAAYVAGAAAAMISYYPGKFADAGWIKQRLQVTSWPLVLNSDGTPNDEAKKVSTGLIDPVLALLDPSQHWLKENGRDWRPVKIRTVPDKMNFSDFLDNTAVPVSGKSVARVVRVTDKEPNQWVIYSDRSRDPAVKPSDRYEGEIVRIGPIVRGQQDLNIVLCDSPSPKNLNMIDDLIISVSGIRLNECGP
jgi:hypothetical protein